MAKTRILLAEDHTVVRQGLRRILEADSQMEIVAEVGDGIAAVDAAVRLRPSVCVVDISLPTLNGIEVTRQITKAVPMTSVLILSMHADAAYVHQALNAGAKGYLLKDADDQDLLKAVNAISQGGSYFSPAVSRIVLKGYLQDTTQPPEQLACLSDRERQILTLVAGGKSNKEVAQALGVSVSTVDSHRKHLMEKLDLHNTAALVRFAVQKGLVE